MKKILILLMLATLGCYVQAAPLDDKIKDFAEALKASAAGKADENSRSILIFAGRLTSDSSGGAENLGNTVKSLMASSQDAEVQKTGKAVLEELESEKKARLDALKAKLEEVRVRTSEVLLKAQTPKDVDSLLEELGKLQPDPRGNDDRDVQALAGQFNLAYRYVATWQDYLCYRSGPNTERAQIALQSLSESDRYSDFAPVPRSEILARFASIPKPERESPKTSRDSDDSLSPSVAPILDGVKSPDDLAEAVRLLRALPKNDIYMIRQISMLAGRYGDAKNGLPVSIELEPDYGGIHWGPGLERIRAMVLIYLLPRYIGSEALTPNPGETVDAYLKRSFDAAEAKSDWLTLQRVLQAQVDASNLRLPSGSVRKFVAGLNQEMAGQQMMAVISYQNALRQPEDHLPIKLIGARLAAIKKEFPKEYEEAMVKILNPPAPIYMTRPEAPDTTAKKTPAGK